MPQRRGEEVPPNLLTNPATHGCRTDEGERAVERLLDGARVGEETLLEHVQATGRPGRIVLEPQGLESAVLAEGFGEAE